MLLSRNWQSSTPSRFKGRVFRSKFGDERFMVDVAFVDNERCIQIDNGNEMYEEKKFVWECLVIETYIEGWQPGCLRWQPVLRIIAPKFVEKN